MKVLLSAELQGTPSYTLIWSATISDVATTVVLVAPQPAASPISVTITASTVLSSISGSTSCQARTAPRRCSEDPPTNAPDSRRDCCTRVSSRCRMGKDTAAPLGLLLTSCARVKAAAALTTSPAANSFSPSTSCRRTACAVCARVRRCSSMAACWTSLDARVRSSRLATCFGLLAMVLITFARSRPSGRSRLSVACSVMVGALLVFGRACILPVAPLLRWTCALFASFWLVRRDTGMGDRFHGGCGASFLSTPGRGVSVAASSFLSNRAADKVLADSSPRVSPENASYTLIHPPPTLTATSDPVLLVSSPRPSASCAI